MGERSEGRPTVEGEVDHVRGRDGQHVPRPQQARRRYAAPVYGYHRDAWLRRPALDAIVPVGHHGLTSSRMISKTTSVPPLFAHASPPEMGERGGIVCCRGPPWSLPVCAHALPPEIGRRGGKV